MKRVTIAEALEMDCPVVDVRTPKEFEEFHIPGAISMPIFSNEERVRVGTTYKQVGKEEAKELGISLVSPKLPEFYKRAKEISNGRPIIIYCWRGGMRSRTLATVFEVMGLKSYQLEGGIRSFRKKVVADLDAIASLQRTFIVLEGLTGTKKTEILEQLQEKNYPVLDLEGLAAHRGSVFGRVDLPDRSQKDFDMRLWERIQEIGETDYYIIESESKRLGNIEIPKFIIDGKQAGPRIHVHTSIPVRIDTILATYQPEQNHEAIEKAWEVIRKRIAAEAREIIDEALTAQDYRTVTEQLLIHYYDPKYKHASKDNDGTIRDVFFETLEEAVELVQGHVDYLAEELSSGDPVFPR
ncbi:tRNA 2-selenouridine synthase [Thalassobacillus cyri]|uniref:tRNA 2-selenouridine synthase n=1 Tax=Thalassobacillus cyri TaxID=571932 RepID=A0A1H4FRN2_9BACI|nr:tRNA 2-selenouridine(34) synthase MnmH [Thalassobacillus cyri]SEA99172.1 tRNA 2-selenouridine synthase [Thalassobacillus cyri]